LANYLADKYMVLVHNKKLYDSRVGEEGITKRLQVEWMPINTKQSYVTPLTL